MIVRLILIGLFIIKIINFILCKKLADSEIAAQNRHKEIVEFLSRKGADFHHKDINGCTSLMRGIYY